MYVPKFVYPLVQLDKGFLLGLLVLLELHYCRYDSANQLPIPTRFVGKPLGKRLIYLLGIQVIALAYLIEEVSNLLAHHIGSIPLLIVERTDTLGKLYSGVLRLFYHGNNTLLSLPFENQEEQKTQEQQPPSYP